MNPTPALGNLGAPWLIGQPASLSTSLPTSLPTRMSTRMSTRISTRLFTSLSTRLLVMLLIRLVVMVAISTQETVATPRLPTPPTHMVEALVIRPLEAGAIKYMAVLPDSRALAPVIATALRHLVRTRQHRLTESPFKLPDMVMPILKDTMPTVGIIWQGMEMEGMVTTEINRRTTLPKISPITTPTQPGT